MNIKKNCKKTSKDRFSSGRPVYVKTPQNRKKIKRPNLLKFKSINIKNGKLNQNKPKFGLKYRQKSTKWSPAYIFLINA